jgi:glycosyltransferase involved in cell wall biosynthesis
MLLAGISGLPFTFETHAYDLFVDFPFSDQKLKRASRVFTISNYNRSYIVDELGGDPAKVSVMRVPIDLAHCDGLPALDRDPNLVITACRLHPIKGIDVAIDAFAKLEQTYPDLRFEIIGDGPLKPSLERKVRGLGLEHKIHFLGNMGNRAVLERITGAGMFVLPSVIASDGDRDGVPTSLIEAMYLRTPVVGSDVSGIPELIDDGVNGLLARSGDSEELARRMGRLRADESLRACLGEAGRRKVLEEFYRDDCDDILYSAWTEILESRSRSGYRQTPVSENT